VTARQRSGTIADRIRDTGGYTSGFDYLRLILSILVLFGHSFVVSGDYVDDKLMPWGINTLRDYAILPIFFSLSGFLVAASLVRTKSLLMFLTLRGLRIVPALFVEITLSALVLGPLLTTVNLREYFTGIEFFQYFLNVIGYIHYRLPGVFLNHPSTMVNGSLWTVPYEAECYIALAIFALIGLVKRLDVFLIGFLALTIALCVWTFGHGDPDLTRITASGRQLVLFFLGGVLLYMLRERVPWSGWLALSAAIISAPLIISHIFIYLVPLPVAYLTAYIGLLQPKKLPIVFTGDYSYGIYLYAFPIQQAVYQLVPSSTSWYINFLLALAAVSVFAAFSWHCIERPALKLKRFILTKAERGQSAAGEMISPDKTVTAVAEAEGGIKSTHRTYPQKVG
jgi:peptidoglycan/LPS O-acetylase OafA/YrhL